MKETYLLHTADWQSS